MQSLRQPLILAACAILAVSFVLVACDEDPAGSCERIVEACHERDTGSGLTHDCPDDGATDEVMLRTGR